MSENSLFPRRSDIFKGEMADVRDSIARPSIDTFYQVTFSFGKYDRWLRGTPPDKRRTQSAGFQRKMSLLCTQAEIPGTQYQTSTATGHHQGIVEEFPDFRTFPPLNLTFYCDADMVILEVLERWMTFINPVVGDQRRTNSYTRFSYPEDYKEIIHITKFERDTFTEDAADYKSALTSYEFVNIWPTNLTSMRVAYGDSNVLRCSVQFAYDRFFTSFNYNDTNQAVLNQPSVVNSNDIQGGFLPSNPQLKSPPQSKQPFPVQLESGQYTTTGTNSMLPLGGV